MRLHILIHCMLICTFMRAKISFDTLFLHSNFVVKAKVISNTPSPATFDQGTIEGKCDILINMFCTGGQASSTSLSLHIGDTLKNIAYAESDAVDTLSTGKTYLFPIITDNDKFKLTVGDFNYGVFADTALLDKNCQPVKVSTETASLYRETVCGKKTIDWYYYPSGNIKSKIIYWKISDHESKSIRRTWDESGKLQYHGRQRSYVYGRNVKRIIWTFRRNGHLCLYRGKQFSR